MAQWGKNEDAANSVLWAAQQLKVTANSDNQTALFGNTTADAFITGVTVGQFAVDANEIAADGGKEAHTGWVLRTTGSGGRSGRVMTEVLVAGGIATDDEDTVYPDYTISITTQPEAASANATADEQATFTVVATSVPTTTLTYAWTYANGDAIAETSNATAASLVVDANTAVDATEYKVTVSATGATSVVSSNVAIEVTT